MSTGNATRSSRSFDTDEAPRKPQPAMSCAECKAVCRTMYFNLDGRPLCPKCSTTYRERIDRGTGPTAMGRAVLYGTGAAFASSLILALILSVMGGVRIFAALGVAYIIAKSIDKATASYGGRHYQILAVTLTYCAVAFAMLLPVIRAASTLNNVTAPAKQEARFGPAGQEAAIQDELNDLAAQPEEGEDPAVTEARADSIAQADSVRRLEQTKANLAAKDPNFSAAAKLKGDIGSIIMAAFGLLVVLPLMSSFAYGLYAGAFGILLFAVAMHRAWKMTELVTDYELTGPFRVGEGPIPPTFAG